VVFSLALIMASELPMEAQRLWIKPTL